MKNLLCGMAAVLLSMVSVLSAAAGEGQKYTLRYKFHPGETIRWEVEHRLMVRATVSRDTQTTETLSTSVSVWRVGKVQPDGAATFEHRVEWVDMRQKLTGRGEVHFDSRTDKTPPAGFEDAAKSVGIPLSVVKMDVCGKVLKRKDRKKNPQAAPASPESVASNRNWITIPLPDEPVAVGHTWSLPQDIEVPLPSGAVKKIKAVQQFVLEDVKTGVATIRVSTDILTPITDPAVESQLVEREAAGRVRFDIDAGRILGEQMDIDKHVVGFRGDASSIHYINRFSRAPAARAGQKVERRGAGRGRRRLSEEDPRKWRTFRRQPPPSPSTCDLRHLGRLASNGIDIGGVFLVLVLDVANPPVLHKLQQVVFGEGLRIHSEFGATPPHFIVHDLVGVEVGIAAGPHHALLMLEMRHRVLDELFHDRSNPRRVMAHPGCRIQIVNHAEKPFVLVVHRGVADAVKWFPLDVMFHDLHPMIRANSSIAQRVV